MGVFSLRQKEAASKCRMKKKKLKKGRKENKKGER